MTSSMLAEMTTNPMLGIFIFTLGGLAGAIFYLPFKKVKNWAWESYWLVYALFALLIVPGVLVLATSPNAMAVLKITPIQMLGYICLCGAAWGVGGLTWGLMIRYLGVGLGLALGCGLCSAAGTIIPKIINKEVGTLFEPGAGITSFIGVLVSIAGIVFVGLAGMSKENEVSEEEKKKTVAEFNFRRGIMVVLFSGLMSASLNFGLQGGPDIELKAQYGSESTLVKGKENMAPKELVGVANVLYDKDKGFWVLPRTAAGETLTSRTWRGIPVLVVALLGGFAVNFLWCLFLNFKNKTTGDYTKSGTPIIGNFLFSGIAGAIWCSQFICFKTGEPAMGPTAYVGWSVLMASAILFSSLLGVMLGEWKGTSGKTRGLLVVGLLLLVASSVVAGYSGYLGQPKTPAVPSAAIEKAPLVQ
jgi:L-rhamnose-H+ transport protein